MGDQVRLFLFRWSNNYSPLIWMYLSASVGQYAIQLLTLSGYKVITVASPRNFGLVKSLGATAVFDVRRFHGRISSMILIVYHLKV